MRPSRRWIWFALAALVVVVLVLLTGDAMARPGGGQSFSGGSRSGGSSSGGGSRSGGSSSGGGSFSSGGGDLFGSLIGLLLEILFEALVQILIELAIQYPQVSIPLILGLILVGMIGYFVRSDAGKRLHAAIP